MMKSALKKLVLGDSPLTRAAVRLMARPGPITMLMLVRDEADVIAQNLEFHQRFGIQHFVVTDNGSTDGTREILADFQRRMGKSLIVLDDAEPVHHQATRVNRMIALAKQQCRPRWIISSDADEFWYPVSGDYASELDGRKNILNCYWHNFLPRAGAHWQQFTEIGEMPGYHARIRKLFTLSAGLFGMYHGNHDSRSIPSIAADSGNIRLYHYPVRTYAQFESKVVRGYRATLQAGYEKDAAWHWREYYEAWQRGELPQLYAELAERNSTAHDSTMAEEFARHGAGAAPTSA